MKPSLKAGEIMSKYWQPCGNCDAKGEERENIFIFDEFGNIAGDYITGKMVRCDMCGGEKGIWVDSDAKIPNDGRLEYPPDSFEDFDGSVTLENE